MSSNLTIEPTLRKKTDLSDQLKFVLRKRVQPVNLIVDANDIVYFQALRHVGIDDAQTVIDMIEKHGTCKIEESW